MSFLPLVLFLFRLPVKGDFFDSLVMGFIAHLAVIPLLFLIHPVVTIPMITRETSYAVVWWVTVGRESWQRWEAQENSLFVHRVYYKWIIIVFLNFYMIPNFFFRQEKCSPVCCFGTRNTSQQAEPYGKNIILSSLRPCWPLRWNSRRRSQKRRREVKEEKEEKKRWEAPRGGSGGGNKGPLPYFLYYFDFLI